MRILPNTPAETCVRCRRRKAITHRQTVSYVGTWNRAEAVCRRCANELDGLAEKCNRGAISVDRVVRNYQEKLAA
jgi:hypothetical protein